MKLLEIRNSKRKVDFELKISDFGLRSEISERTLKIELSVLELGCGLVVSKLTQRTLIFAVVVLRLREEEWRTEMRTSWC